MSIIRICLSTMRSVSEEFLVLYFQFNQMDPPSRSPPPTHRLTSLPPTRPPIPRPHTHLVTTPPSWPITPPHTYKSIGGRAEVPWKSSVVLGSGWARKRGTIHLSHPLPDQLLTLPRSPHYLLLPRAHTGKSIGDRPKVPWKFSVVLGVWVVS